MTKDEIFEKALDFVLKWEGGFVDDPDDRGGATNRGITQATYDQYLMRRGAPSQSVQYIHDQEVHDIYYHDYWLRGKGDVLVEYDENLGVCHFDACVNHGINRAGKFLQLVVSAKPDGYIGPYTLAALQRHLNSGVDVVQKYLDRRESFYHSIVDRDPSQKKFLAGWMNRLNALRQFLRSVDDAFAVNDFTKAFQRLCAQYNIDAGPADGIAGPRTERAAIEAFQRMTQKKIIFKEG